MRVERVAPADVVVRVAVDVQRRRRGPGGAARSATARLLARFSSGAPQVSVIGIGVAARRRRAGRCRRSARSGGSAGSPTPGGPSAGGRTSPTAASARRTRPGAASARAAGRARRGSRRCPAWAVAGASWGRGRRACGRSGPRRSSPRRGRGGRAARRGRAGSGPSAIAWAIRRVQLASALVLACRRGRRAAAAAGAGRCPGGDQRRACSATGDGRAGVGRGEPGGRRVAGELDHGLVAERARGAERVVRVAERVAVDLEPVLHPVDLRAAVLELPDAVAAARAAGRCAGARAPAAGGRRRSRGPRAGRPRDPRAPPGRRSCALTIAAGRRARAARPCAVAAGGAAGGASRPA